MGGGVRAFLRRGKFAPSHSEMDDFLSGRITREQGMLHIRSALLPAVRRPDTLRKKTLADLRAWDLVYLDYLAAGRLVAGEPTAAAEPLHRLSANEALLIRHADSRRLLKQLPPLVQRSLRARLKKMEEVWRHDGKLYDRLLGDSRPKPKVQGPKSKKSRKSKVKSRTSAARSPKSKVQSPKSRVRRGRAR